MPKIPKRQLNVRISAEAIAALEYLAQETTQADVIERLLIAAAKRQKRKNGTTTSGENNDHHSMHFE